MVDPRAKIVELRNQRPKLPPCAAALKLSQCNGHGKLRPLAR